MTCDTCDRVQEMYVEASENEQAALQALRKEQASHRGTKAMLSRELKEHPKAEEAHEAFLFWLKLRAKHPNTTFGTERQIPVQARLTEKPLQGETRLQDVKWAIMGADALPFVGDKGRQADPASAGAKPKDDLELICRHGSHVERFMEYADARAVKAYDAAVATLAHVYGQMLTPIFDGDVEHPERDVDQRPVGWYAPCPCHALSIADLRVRPGSAQVGAWLDVRCVQGCEADAILGALRELAEGQRKAA